MKIFHIRYILLALLFPSSYLATAQQEQTLFFMPAMPQALQYNPAKSLDYKLGITLPVLSGGYFMFSSDGFTLNEASDINGKTATISLENISKSLSNRNYLRMQGAMDWLGIYLQLDSSMSVNFRIGDRINTQFEYPRELFDFLYKGNGHPDFFGKTVNIAPKIHFIHYREYAISGSKSFMDNRLRLGAAVKYLQGISYAATEDLALQITSSAEGNYPLTISSSGSILTSGIETATNNNSDAKDYIKPKGGGVVVDLGFTFQATDKISIEASALNLGSITWKENVKRYAFESVEASYTYEGLDFVNAFKDGGGDAEFQEVVDSLENVFQLQNNGKGVDSGAFSTGAPVQFKAGVRYEVGKHFHLSALASMSSFRGSAFPMFTLAATKDIGRIATVAVSYTAIKNTPFNMGLGISLNTPIQIHIVSDNLFSGLLSPESAKYASVRMGINMVFGSKEKQAKKAQKPLIGEGDGKDMN